MIYKLENGKKKNIPDAEISKYMKALDLTKEEAIQVYLEDEGLLENEEQEELCRKAQDNRITATIHQASAETAKKKTQKERVKKEDAVKEQIIAEMAQFLSEKYENIQIINETKLILFENKGETFKIDLIRQRKKKK
jgi:hypothetical protein